MVLQEHLTERNGSLFIEGVNSLELVREFGTPLFVTSSARVVSNYRRIHRAFSSKRTRFRIHYALKANSNLAVLRLLKREGASADCSSIPEIYFATFAGYRPEEILYSGNYNSDEELKFALESGVTINLDDGPLLNRLVRFGKPEIISFRINPGVGKGGFAGITTAGPAAKFGMREREAIAAYRTAAKLGIKRFGMHMMTGSNILDCNYFGMITGRLMKIASDVSRELGISFDFIDIGGGFGIPYGPSENELDITHTAELVVNAFEEALSSNSGIGNPELVIEPGRYIVGDSTVLLSSVTHVKRSYSTFVGCDAGMNVLLRPALYGAYHEVLIANAMTRRAKSRVNITGQICENTDIIARNRMLASARSGDILAILNAGAYGFSMGSRYNGRPLAAEVMIIGGRAELTREREGFAEMLSRQRVPPSLL